jgi:hypothetical protein
MCDLKIIFQRLRMTKMRKGGCTVQTEPLHDRELLLEY